MKSYFALLALSLILSIGMVLTHFLWSDASAYKERSVGIVQATHMGMIAFGGDYLEARVRLADTAMNPVYPEMIPLERRGFVYAD